MRTTVTLTPEADGVVRRLMAERGLTFKEAVNTAIIDGSRAPQTEPYRLPTFDLGLVPIPGHRALALAADLDDEEIIRRLEARR